MVSSGTDNLSVVCQYDLSNRLTLEVKTDSEGIHHTEYTYDYNGNQVLKYYWSLIFPSVGGIPGVSLGTDVRGLDLFSYDGLNRLTSTSVGGVRADYSYKTDGLRISKTIDGVVTRHIWDGSNITAEVDSNGDVISLYLRGINLISTTDSDTGDTLYFVFNAHGDVVQLLEITSVTVTVILSYQYDAFGVEVNPNPDDTNPFRYCGEYYDAETGNYYLRARYYDPVVGRLIQQDGWEYANPNDPLSLNLYTYCWNNPIKYHDPEGTTMQDIMQGLASTIDKDVFGGFFTWVIQTITGYNKNYVYESEYDYYLGRVIGGVLSLAIGIGLSIQGALTIIGSIAAGGSIMIGSGGTLAIGGIAISAAGVAEGAIEITLGAGIVLVAGGNIGNDFNAFKNIQQTTKEATEAANNLGYRKTNYYSQGKPVYERVSGSGPKYITPDRTSHNGGAWKGANSVDGFGENTRLGTYDANLNWIGK